MISRHAASGRGRRAWLGLLFAAALLLVASRGVTRAAPRRAADGLLTGRVTDLVTGMPLAGASVSADAARVTTDASGAYRLRVRPGRRDVRVSLAGYDRATIVAQEFTAVGARLDVGLPPLGAGAAEMRAAAERLRAWSDATAVSSSDAAGTSIGDTRALVRPAVAAAPDVVRVLMPDGQIVEMETDAYVKGVVPAEMGYVFRRAYAALAAQAIAARTYAAVHCLPASAGDPAVCEPGLDANVDTTTNTQVWRPVHYDSSDAAVDATHAQVVRVAGALVPTLYFARTRGRTLASEDSRCCGGTPWAFLRSVSSPEAYAERWGHGAGMSQEGAAVFADWGATAEEIVTHYYRGAVIDPPARPAPPVTATPASRIAATGGAGASAAAVRAGVVAFDAAELRATAPGTIGANALGEASGGVTLTVESPVIGAPFSFMALAADWQGDPEAAGAVTVSVRTREVGGEWSPWSALPVGDADIEGKAALPEGVGWSGLLIQRGRYAQLRVSVPAAADGPTALDRISLHYLDASAGPAAPAASASGASPAVVSRATWGADESLRFDKDGHEIWPPEYTVPLAHIVHHTVTANSPADPAAVVRSIYYYHAVTRGWGDIGYNFLVDHRGVIYEGRAGGERDGRIARGGHALQYNANTIGVALLGTYTDGAVRPPAAAEAGLVQLLADRCARYAIPPNAGVTLLGTTFASGILGHRDVLPGHTACPGDGLAARLAAIRSAVAAAMTARPTPTATRRPATATPRLPTPTPTRPAPSTTPRPPTPWPAGCADLVADGGFETGDDGWVRNRAYVTTWDVWRGQRSLFVGLVNSDADTATTYASVARTVHLPDRVGAAELTFVARARLYGGDRAFVRLLDPNGAVIALGGVPVDAASWTSYRFDLAPALARRAGQDVRIYWAVVNNGDGQRSFIRLDDVALHVCAPGAAPSSATAGAPADASATPEAAPTGALVPTDLPTATRTAVPTSTGGALPSATDQPTATPTLVCGALVREGFEADAPGGAPPGWATWGAHPSIRVDAPAHDGGGALRLGLIADDDAAFDFAGASRAISVPLGAVTGTLTLAVHALSGSPEDAFVVELRRPADGTRQRLLGLAVPGEVGRWDTIRVAVDLRGLSGPAELFLAVLDRGHGVPGSARTTVVVDDLALDVCARPPATTRVLPWAWADHARR